jgi:hypothetical protein
VPEPITSDIYEWPATVNADTSVWCAEVRMSREDSPERTVYIPATHLYADVMISTGKGAQLNLFARFQEGHCFRKDQLTLLNKED